MTALTQHRGLLKYTRVICSWLAREDKAVDVYLGSSHSAIDLLRLQVCREVASVGDDRNTSVQHFVFRNADRLSDSSVEFVSVIGGIHCLK